MTTILKWISDRYTEYKTDTSETMKKKIKKNKITLCNVRIFFYYEVHDASLLHVILNLIFTFC